MEGNRRKRGHPLEGSCQYVGPLPEHFFHAPVVFPLATAESHSVQRPGSRLWWSQSATADRTSHPSGSSREGIGSGMSIDLWPQLLTPSGLPFSLGKGVRLA